MGKGFLDTDSAVAQASVFVPHGFIKGLRRTSSQIALIFLTNSLLTPGFHFDGVGGVEVLAGS